MYTINENIICEYEISKSRFICLLIKINEEEMIKKELLKIKKKYKDANHYCYAYIIDNKEKSSDNKEPVGTAGIPILNVLKKHNLNHILCVVVRYFGGIKLGTGGLSRAYTKSVTNALNNSIIKVLKLYYKIKIIIDYDKQKELDTILKDSLSKKNYNTKIIYNVIISKDSYFKIESLLNHYVTIIENEFYD